MRESRHALLRNYHLLFSMSLAIAKYDYDYSTVMQHPHAALLGSQDSTSLLLESHLSEVDRLREHYGQYASRVVENSITPSADEDDSELISLQSTKCNNGIVGLFCQDYGCYYNSDCYDGYCNMYSKCSTRSKPAYITDLENQFSNALDGLANQTGETDKADPKDSKPGTSGQTVPTGQPDGGKGVPGGQSLDPAQKTDKQKSADHFEKSPFGNADQLNSFLFWFGVISALLISAFIIQCCREVARGDDIPVNLSPNAKTAQQDDPLARMNQMDPRSLLSTGGQSTEDIVFQNKAYLMHTKQKSYVMGNRTKQAIQHQEDTDKLFRKFNSASHSNQFRSGQNNNNSNLGLSYHSLNNVGGADIPTRQTSTRLNTSGNIFTDRETGMFGNEI